MARALSGRQSIAVIAIGAIGGLIYDVATRPDSTPMVYCKQEPDGGLAIRVFINKGYLVSVRTPHPSNIDEFQSPVHFFRKSDRAFVAHTAPHEKPVWFVATVSRFNFPWLVGDSRAVPFLVQTRDVFVDPDV